MSFHKNQNDSSSFEQEAWSAGAYLCGIDEVGRGCFAGPVVTAAVILKPFKNHSLLIDSKMLSEKNRLAAATWIIKNSWYALGAASAQEIDKSGIYLATQTAMLRSLYGIYAHPQAPFPGHIIIDAMPLSLPEELAQKTTITSFNFAESRSISVAAASILAKVYRDQLMDMLALHYPLYKWHKNKGYGTKDHQSALENAGTCLLHRNSFLSSLINKETSDHEAGQQTSLFC